MIRVHGGFANRMYRLDTDQGSFAVKELNLLDRRSIYRAEDVFRFERAAFAAGVPMPEPISASHRTLVHRWVEGEKMPEAPVSPAYAFEIGEILARIHALDVAWTHVPIEDPASRDWPELAERATATGQPWAGELTSQVKTFLAIANFADACERPGPVVLTSPPSSARSSTATSQEAERCRRGVPRTVRPTSRARGAAQVTVTRFSRQLTLPAGQASA
jgi:Phosphotransferase enzyme family